MSKLRSYGKKLHVEVVKEFWSDMLSDAEFRGGVTVTTSNIKSHTV